MLALVFSSFLFGLANPLGAILVGEEDSMLFTFHFLAALVVIQLPLVLTKWRDVARLATSWDAISLLLVSGLIGTFLYWCEFSSYQVGLPVTHVTFLMLTVPAWSMFYEYLRGRGTRWNMNMWALALVGSIFLIHPNDKGQFSFGLLLPVITSLLMAGWLIFSKKAQEKGIHPFVCSFFNDFFSLIGVLAFILFNGRQDGLTELPANAHNIALYAGLVGVLPSILLLFGLRTTSLVTASAVIMFDPVISGTLSFLINNEVLGANFLIGAIFVCLSTVPENVGEYWEQLKYVFRLVRLEKEPSEV